MATKVYIILGLIAVFAIGFTSIILKLRSVTKSIAFLHQYRNKFVELANAYFSSAYAAARSFDAQTYYWLNLNANKAQRELGMFGVGEYIAPFQRYTIRNYEFITNTIPKFADDQIRQNECHSIDSILLRCIGSYQEIEEGYKAELKNPFKWFQYGVRLLISFPARLLNWFGIINENTVEKITANGFFKVISGIVGLAGFLSSIVTVLTGWEPFTKIVQTLVDNMKK